MTPHMQARTKRHMAVLNTSASQAQGHAASALAVSSCKRHAAIGLIGGDVSLYDVIAGGVHTSQLPGHSGPITALAFAPGGKHLASGGR